MSFRADVEVSVGAVVESLTGVGDEGRQTSQLLSSRVKPPPRPPSHSPYLLQRAAPYVVDLPISPTRRVEAPQKRELLVEPAREPAGTAAEAGGGGGVDGG